MANYYWVGSTAASINSLSWHSLGNWRITSNAVAGSTLARWVTPSRLPLGGDVVYFGSVYGAASAYTPVAIPTYSPCLFGGLTTGTGAGFTLTWSGSTAGTSLAQKKGAMQIYVNPTYPFSQLGGEWNTTILNEWAAQCRRLGSTADAFNVVGSTADGEETAAYYSGAFGATAGELILSKPTQFQGEKFIRTIGWVYDYSLYPTRSFFRGYTMGAGFTGTGGFTYAYDGSYNFYNIGVALDLPKLNYGQNKRAYNGAIPGVTTPSNNNILPHGDSIIAGHWNAVQAVFSTKSGSIFGNGLVCNKFTLAPSTALVYYDGTPSNGFYRTNGFSGGTPVSYTEYDTISFDQTSNTRTLRIGDGSTGIVKSVSTLNVEGDITSTSGFVCTYPQYEGGFSGGTGGIVIVTTTGNLILNPTVSGVLGSNGLSAGSICTVGYPSSDANTKGTNLSAINYIYNMNGSGYEWDIGVLGNLNTTEAVMYGGSFYPDPEISDQNNVEVTQLTMFGDSVLDLSQAPNHKGMDTDVTFKSTAARLIPKDGTKINMSSTQLEADVGDQFV
jgi:hypothetical protein